MDHFYYRFFIPGSILLFIAIINHISRYKYIHSLLFVFCLSLTMSYIVLGLTYYRGEGFKKSVSEWGKNYGSIKPYSVVIFSYSNMTFPPAIMWFRSDIIFVPMDNGTESSIKKIIEENPNRFVYVDETYLEQSNLLNGMQYFHEHADENNRLILLR